MASEENKPKTLSQKIDDFLTPEGITIACAVLVIAGTVAYVVGKFAWLGISKLFGF
jgi:hypothetical protein